MTNTKIDQIIQRMAEDINDKSTPEGRQAASELTKKTQKRRMIAKYKADKALALMHPEEHKTLYDAAYDLLASDARYANVDTIND
ncbi:uncharacterized protein METZ01_LOCUS468666 [marine metagenome]|uniref:Uncharacterized protein n=1 Tax=marine metagenome TaxID=408172 RepID=A0A383B742_9ZZZZ